MNNYDSIKNMLNRFRANKNMSVEDIETTIRDILWNVEQCSKKVST